LRLVKPLFPHRSVRARVVDSATIQPRTSIHSLKEVFMAIKGARPNGRLVTPHLLVRNASEAIEFYKRAFGAVEIYRSALPHTSGIHAKIRIHDSIVMLTDETPPDEEGMGHLGVQIGSPQTLCGTSVLLQLFFDDVDKAYQRAVDAGAKATLPLG